MVHILFLLLCPLGVQSSFLQIVHMYTKNFLSSFFPLEPEEEKKKGNFLSHHSFLLSISFGFQRVAMERSRVLHDGYRTVNAADNNVNEGAHWILGLINTKPNSPSRQSNRLFSDGMCIYLGMQGPSHKCFACSVIIQN